MAKTKKSSKFDSHMIYTTCDKVIKIPPIIGTVNEFNTLCLMLRNIVPLSRQTDNVLNTITNLHMYKVLIHTELNFSNSSLKNEKILYNSNQILTQSSCTLW